MFQKIIKVNSGQRKELIDLTEEIGKIIKESKMREGICYLFVPHTTAALIINENADPNINADFLNCLSKLIPKGKWLHDMIDNNADSHLKSILLGPSQLIPFKEGKLQLGRWQAILLAEFDGPRERQIIINLLK